MKSLNSCRELLAILLLALCSAQVARAIDPDRTLSQYVYERWGTESGFPRGPVYSIAQTKDGYLWIGTESGLIRFDGLTFHPMQFAASGQSALTHVLGLISDSDGSLWARLRRPSLTLLRYKGGVFDDPMSVAGGKNASVAAMTRGRDDDPVLWLLEGEPSVVALRGGRFETLANLPGISRSAVLAIAQTPNGDIWAGTRDAGLFRLSGGKVSYITEGLPDLKVNSLVSAGDNQLWVGTDGGVVRWDGTKLTNAGLSSLGHIQALAMTVDRDSSLWIGTNSQGLLRFNGHGVAAREEPNGRANYAITALFEDREGDLWVGSESGLERIRDSPFVTFSLPEGLPADGAKPLFMDSENSLWFGPVEGGLWRTKEGRHGRVSNDGLDQDVVYSIAGGDAGELWVGRQHGGLTRLSFSAGSTSRASTSRASTTAHTYTERDGLAQNSIFSVYQARDGAVWAGTLSGGASRFKDGHFTNYTTADGLASDTVNAMAESSDGVLWFATPEGLSSLSQGHWRSWRAGEGLPATAVNCLLEDKAGVLWAGTAAGLAFRGPKNFQVPPSLPPALKEEILGMAQDRFGSIWIATSSHVLRVNSDKLLAGALAEDDIRQFGLTDGLRGVEGVKRFRSVVTDSLGRVWLSLNHGISVVDPARLRNNSVPVIPHVQSILVDGKPIGVIGANPTGANPAGTIHIPSGRNRLTFDYAGLSLSIPERVRFRYQLEGFDHGWSEPVTSREAIYTSLQPGPYRFRVIASNPDGVWSSDEADAGFEVDPVFWQTWRFQMAAVVGCFVIGVTLYRFRLHQMTRQLNVRFDERLAERTRIAQELHDTLLQGFISASMQVHVVADQLPMDSQAKAILTRAQQLMGQVIDEGRNTVRGLRSSKTASLDLEEAFSRIRQEAAPQREENEHIGFRVIVEGERRPLHPLLRDEVYRIGREALLNAFHHARATSIDVELRYSSSQLRILVRDDGCGIDPHVVDSGRDGHWGLSGMRERADRIGARFHVWSGATGTEIEVSVPSQIAFKDHRNQGLAWFGKHFKNGTGK